MGPVGAVGGFGHGVGLLVRGQRLWTRRPALMALGLLPAVIVAIAMVALLVTLLVYVGDLVSWATPFADSWAEGWRELTRVLVEVGVMAGAGFLFMVSFTGLTMALGDPFYERIWMAVERELGGDVPDRGVGWLRGAADGIVLAGYGLVTALVVFAVGLVPVVGAVAGAALGIAVAGHALGTELVSRPLEARGMDHQARTALLRPHRATLLRPHRATLLGFGVAVQVCFLVPFGGILMMPGAVAGATYLAREALERSP